MQTSLKILSATLISSSTIAPTFLTSCSSTTIADDVIDQFKKLTTAAPHCSNLKVNDDAHNLRQIKNYYKNLVEKEFHLQWIEQDDGINEYWNPYEGNAYFDIPATRGYENKPTIILQGHIDMVFAHVDKENVDYHSYIVQLEESKDENGNRILHSKNNQSTIGADNGIAIAVMLALAKNKDKFNHGKIRCMFTTDEDVGMVGAAEVPKHWFNDTDGKPIKYLLNLDSENIHETSISCMGSFNSEYDIGFYDEALNEITSDYKCFALEASNFKGGHSSLMSSGKIANCLQELAKVIKTNIFESDYSDSLIYDISTIGTDSTNVIPEKCVYKVAIKTTESEQVVINKLQAILDASINEIKTKYTNETNAIFSINSDSTTHKYGVNPEYSLKLLNLVVGLDCCKINENTSANICPVSLTIYDEDMLAYFYLGYKPRSKISADLALANSQFSLTFNNNFKPLEVTSEYFGTSGRISRYNPWEYREVNPMRDVIVNAYQVNNIELKLEATDGGIEPAIFAEKSPTLNMGSIGVTIADAHKVTERIYLDTIDPAIKIILQIINDIE